MSENGLILLKTLQLLVEEHGKPDNERCEHTIERYKDAICSLTDQIIEEKPDEIKGSDCV